jgi:hypothetical protein
MKNGWIWVRVWGLEVWGGMINDSWLMIDELDFITETRKLSRRNSIWVDVGIIHA